MPTRARPFIALLPTLLASAALLSGCSTTRLTAALDDGSGAPLPGIPYRLPTKAVVVDTTWLLDSCTIAPMKGSYDQITVGFATTATIGEQLGEGERLVLDYTKMATTFKTSKIDVSYWKVGEGKAARQTALLKSINAEIKGEEPAALEAGIKAAGSIASLALGLPAIPGQGNAPRNAQGESLPALVCNPTLFAPIGGAGEAGHITRLKRAPARLKEITQAVADATLQLSAIRTRTLGTLSDRDQQAFDSLNAQVEKLDRERDALTKDAALITAAFGIKRSVTHSPGAPAAGSISPVTLARIAPPAEKVLALISKAICNPAVVPTAGDCAPYIEDAFEKQKTSVVAIATDLTVDLNMHPPLAALPTLARNGTAALKDAAAKGIAYREPVALRFSLDLPALVNADPTQVARRAAETLADATIVVPQLGTISFLPLQSGFGEKVELKAEFEPDGMPIRTAHGKIEAGGTALLKSLQSGADTVAGLVDVSKAKADAKAKEAAGSELANLNARIELLTAQNKIATLEKAATPDPAAADRAAELEILRFDKEKAELRRAIAKATAP
ncbi:hypothetical protein CHU93_16830 [Sandarakinorhabdus cyanobacteriorum]|uniref:Uncharacterized protein n=1 Tax=Sandarakinorhabdus cyanobacteriorum TaxID=1981098 RepID=A0A255Y3M1_9SPHN|nr:hypothetical protein [Sandarakinorhabdus cyanobacteriorum]OYQ23857.1 hypothetical protein CHU93_16830 [Sandarakinorhabdus cyanobacteriorum]